MNLEGAIALATCGRSGPPVHLGPGGPDLELALAEACCEAFFSTPVTIRCRNLAPGFLAGLLPASGSGTIHLDDPHGSPGPVLPEVLSVLGGRLGGWTLPPGWRIAWTGTGPSQAEGRNEIAEMAYTGSRESPRLSGTGGTRTCRRVE